MRSVTGKTICCPECGHERDSHGRFCIFCGYDFKKIATDRVFVEGAVVWSPDLKAYRKRKDHTAKQKQRVGCSLVAFVAAIMILAFIASVIFILVESN